MRILSILVMALAWPVAAFANSGITVTDLANREVTISAPARHIVLGEGRFLPSLAILDGAATTGRIAGMMGEFKKYDPASYAAYQEALPGIDQIPLIGSSGGASFSIEKTFSVEPDLAIFGLGSGHGPNDRDKVIIDQLQAAGVPVIFIDFRIDPIVNTPKSLRLLGKVMGREKEAEAFLSWYQPKLQLIQERLSTTDNRPTVFLESRVGLRPECCEAMGQAMMGRFVTWAGGKNAYGDIIPGTHGMVNLEHLMTRQPDYYIGTAIGSWMTVEKFPNFIALGANTSKELAQASLEKALQRTGITDLDAVQSGKAYTIWHHFYNTPMHVAAIEAMAKWLHPDLFADLDPDATLKTYFDQYQPVMLDGVYWTERQQ